MRAFARLDRAERDEEAVRFAIGLDFHFQPVMRFGGALMEHVLATKGGLPVLPHEAVICAWHIDGRKQYKVLDA